MSQPTFRPRRSLIFMPGHKPDMFPKALKAGADIVTVDLEDAAAPNDKDAARERTVALFTTDEAKSADGPEKLIRINSLRSADGLKDVTAILDAGALPAGLMLPKVRAADDVRLIDEVLSEAGSPIALHVIIETNDALEHAYGIARASGRVASLLFGGVDISAELRCEQTWDNLLYARSRVVHAAAGAEVDLIDVPWLDLDDEEGMRHEAEASAALGFTGKGAIHPKQIAALNEIFSPSADAVAHAQRIVRAFDEADGGLVVIDGKLIEKPVLRSMQRTLAVAESAGRA
jgi:(S)-citramalyl-CoA lyase